MKKLILINIPFFIIGMIIFHSCSQDESVQLTRSMTSSISTGMEKQNFVDYTELGVIPEEFIKEMDDAEKEAWLKLSTKYYIKKNAFSSDFYQKHKAGILERIAFLYDYAVKKNEQPSYLSFVWADKETERKVLKLVDNNDTTIIEEQPEDSGYVDNPKKEWYNRVSCKAYGDYYPSMTLYLDYKVVETKYSVTIEAMGDSWYELFPFNAYYSGTAGIGIDECYMARCSAYGYIHLNSQKYLVNCVSSCDLLEHYNSTKPQY